MASSKDSGHSQLIQSPDLRNPLLTRQIFSTRVSAPSEELPSEQRLLISQLSLWRALCTKRLVLTSRCSWLVHQECYAQQDHVFHRLRPFALSNDKCHLSFETEIGYWGLWLVKAVEVFQDGLAKTWQTEMFS